jgi:glyoxylase-like metal-dependent hydrolase (beta-lactamase superfamily II)
MNATYEILALRYAVFKDRLHFQNFILPPDDHASVDPMDFYLFAIRGNGRTIVMDTGFSPESGARRGRTILRTPAQSLLDAGIDPATVEDVVLTHMHWDHAGGMAYFPRAKFHIQQAEMTYCTGGCMCEPFLRRPYDVEDVRSAIDALYSDRLAVYEGTKEIAPGITLHLIGGHSGGIQSIRVPTKRGWVVLAGDATHYWRNIRLRNPFPVVYDVGRMLKGFEILNGLADGPDHVIPGHDPLILRNFPLLSGNPDIARLDLPPM